MNINEVHLFKQEIGKMVKTINFGKFTKIFVLVDEHTIHDCYPLVQKHLPKHEVFKIKSGEIEKTLATCTAIWQQMTEIKMDRKSLMINLGGGVIGDMGGFCASAYKRGIGFVNIPTTLLAQVDASVGGKTGIDFNGFKNHIGFFKIPNLVLVHPIFLKTLPKKELRSGFAEVIKHCLIQDKVAFHSLQAQDWETLNYYDWIEHSIKIKTAVVAADPKESGWRKILNFGHTIGHAIETYFLNITGERLLHGEAIAIGMICETYLSVKKLGLSPEAANQIYAFLKKIYQPKIWADELDQTIIELMSHDKKNEGGNIECVLLQDIGNPRVSCVVSKQEIAASLTHFRTLINNL